MFKNIFQLVQAAPLLMKLDAQPEGKLAILIQPTPAKADGAPALTKPLRLVGTPEELDAEFAGLIERFSTSYVSMKDAVDAAVAVTEAARAEAGKRAADAVKGKAAGGGKPAAAPVRAVRDGTDAVEEDAGTGDDGGESTQPDAVPAEAAKSAVPSLF